MLEIKDISAEDRIFHFMNSLQTWLQSELHRQNVQTIVTTITDNILDFKVEAKVGPNNDDGQCEK
jgi:hypothetical protein